MSELRQKSLWTDWATLRKGEEMMRQQLIDFYLDWVNNWITMERFAEHHGLDEVSARSLVVMGEAYHHDMIPKL